MTWSESLAAASARAALSLGARSAKPVGELGDLRAQRADGVAGALQRREPGRRLLPPGQHVVDGRAVLAAERGQHRLPLLHTGQPHRVDLDALRVGRQVEGKVGGEVRQLGGAVGERRELGIVLAYRLEGSARGRGERCDIGCLDRLLAVRGQGGMRLLGGGAQRLGVGQPVLLAAQRLVLAGLRSCRRDLVQPMAQRVDLPGPLLLMGDQVGQLAARPAQPAIGGAVVGQQRSHRLTGEAVERLALRGGLAQPVLLGLAVHGHQLLAERGEHRRGHRRATEVRAGTTLPVGGERAGEDCRAVLELPACLLYQGGGLGQPGEHDGALDPGLPTPVTDQAAVGAASLQQRQRGHDHGLAGSGLAGDGGESGPEGQCRIVDDTEAAKPDLLPHR